MKFSALAGQLLSLGSLLWLWYQFLSCSSNTVPSSGSRVHILWPCDMESIRIKRLDHWRLKALDYNTEHVARRSYLCTVGQSQGLSLFMSVSILITQERYNKKSIRVHRKIYTLNERFGRIDSIRYATTVRQVCRQFRGELCGWAITIFSYSCIKTCSLLENHIMVCSSLLTNVHAPRPVYYENTLVDIVWCHWYNR